jgi:hypothetical protein
MMAGSGLKTAKKKKKRLHSANKLMPGINSLGLT